mmetsp:Transcript_73865/g.196652  ORF Transcript_73865/g.196652 Transcript_73865/m.196652 type:complete len:211 (+) Transcript_73865:2268-2900(+)
MGPGCCALFASAVSFCLAPRAPRDEADRVVDELWLACGGREENRMLRWFSVSDDDWCSDMFCGQRETVEVDQPKRTMLGGHSVSSDAMRKSGRDLQLLLEDNIVGDEGARGLLRIIQTHPTTRSAADNGDRLLASTSFSAEEAFMEVEWKGARGSELPSASETQLFLGISQRYAGLKIGFARNGVGATTRADIAAALGTTPIQTRPGVPC